MSQKPARKAALLAWAKQAAPKLAAKGRAEEAATLLAEASDVTLADRMGKPARTLLAHFQRLHGLAETGSFNRRTVRALRPWMPKVKKRYRIGESFRAVAHGGIRSLKSIRNPVVHCMQYDDTSLPDGSAEALGGLTESRSYGASPHFGIDDDSIQQYLPLRFVGWHAQGDNVTTYGIELAGYAHWTRKQWLAHEGMLDMCAYVLAKYVEPCGYPLVYCNAGSLRDGDRGVTTHADVTKAFRVVGGHTDPGKGFPMDVLLAKARSLAA